ncbi:MAG: MCP four helix bundle domain-containing protein [Pseudomonadota bacterium]
MSLSKKLYLVLGILVVTAVAIFTEAMIGLNSFNKQVTVVTTYQLPEVRLFGELVLAISDTMNSEKAAIIADTEEASKKNAESAEAFHKEADKDLQMLKDLYQDDPKASGQERSLLMELEKDWEAFEKTDKDILSLAVQNTNLKAMDAALKQVQPVRELFLTTLSKLVPEWETAGDAQKLTVGFRMITAIDNTYANIFSHINSSSKAEMDTLEKKNTEYETTLKGALQKLMTEGSETEKAALTPLIAKLDETLPVIKQIF